MIQERPPLFILSPQPRVIMKGKQIKYEAYVVNRYQARVVRHLHWVWWVYSFLKWKMKGLINKCFTPKKAINKFLHRLSWLFHLWWIQRFHYPSLYLHYQIYKKTYFGIISLHYPAHQINSFDVVIQRWHLIVTRLISLQVLVKFLVQYKSNYIRLYFVSIM